MTDFLPSSETHCLVSQTAADLPIPGTGPLNGMGVDWKCFPAHQLPVKLLLIRGTRKNSACFFLQGTLLVFSSKPGQTTQDIKLFSFPLALWALSLCLGMPLLAIATRWQKVGALWASGSLRNHIFLRTVSSLVTTGKTLTQFLFFPPIYDSCPTSELGY